MPGIKAAPVFFTPNSNIYQGKKCGGVSLTITEVEKLNSVLVGLSIISVLHKLYRNEFQMEKVVDLLGNSEAVRRLQKGGTPAEVLRADSSRMRDFMAKRQRALIYDGTPRRKKERQ